MEFKDEIIKKLADEGIVFTKNNTGSILTYHANYDHAEATGNLDQAIEDFQATIGGYTDLK